MPLTWRRRTSSVDMVEAPMKTLLPKYSDGRREMRPFMRVPIFLTFQLAPKLTSVFQSRSPIQYEPHSTTA